ARRLSVHGSRLHCRSAWPRALPLPLAVAHGLRLHGALRDHPALAEPLIEQPAAPVEPEAAADRAESHGRAESDALTDRPAERAGEKCAESAENSAHRKR